MKLLLKCHHDEAGTTGVSPVLEMQASRLQVSAGKMPAAPV
ncbi:MAG: hypothetical protein PHY48_10000 [Candidatus Cloacimonetes bacterium]|nr:hypothetical protein [Candidatus Cloacimonadota bacterium]